MKKTILTAAFLALVATSGFGAIVLQDAFTYPVGPLIGNIPPVGPGLPWNTHSGATPGQVDVTAAGVVTVTGSETEDVNAPFAATGFAFQTGVVSATFDINFSALPTAAGTYFVHFKDATPAGFRGRLYALTTGAAAGNFRLAIGDSATAPNAAATLALDLLTATIYNVTLSIDTATGRSSFAVNGGTVVSANDTTTPLPISSFALRQATGEGTLTVDNLVVNAASPATVLVPEPTTAITLLSGFGMLGLIRRRRQA